MKKLVLLFKLYGFSATLLTPLINKYIDTK